MNTTNDTIEIKDEDIQENDFSEQELSDDSIDWKAKAQELKGIAKRRATQLGKVKVKLGEFETKIKDLTVEQKPPVKKGEEKSDGLDYGQKAFLRASGIEPTEFDFVEEHLKESGIKELEKLLANKYFQSSLKDRRDAEANLKATPKEGRGATTGDSKTKVDYWLGKGELPPNTPENTELRRQIVNKRLEIEKNRNKFSSQPIVVAK